MKRSSPLKRSAPMRKNGGFARAAKLSPERRSEIAAMGGEARKQARLLALLNVEHQPPRAVMAANLGGEPRRQALQKVLGRVDQRIRDSARGEDCLIRLPGCPQEPERTIWSHNRHQRAGKGGAIKALDLNGCYGCTWCDAVYDGQAPLPPGMTRDQVELSWYGAHAESLVKLAQKGLL